MWLWRYFINYDYCFIAITNTIDFRRDFMVANVSLSFFFEYLALWQPCDYNAVIPDPFYWYTIFDVSSFCLSHRIVAKHRRPTTPSNFMYAMYAQRFTWIKLVFCLHSNDCFGQSVKINVIENAFVYFTRQKE